MARASRHLVAISALAIALCGCGATSHTSPSTVAQVCVSLTKPNAPGTAGYSKVAVATAKRDYGHDSGVDRFLGSAGSASVDFCSLDNPAPSLHGCSTGQTMLLVTSDGRNELTLPCGAQPTMPSKQ